MPITRQIADQIRLQCAAGNLVPGQRLPSVRELAHQLAINQNTVLRVYERLTVEGILERRHGDGTYVADRLPNGQMRGQKAKLRAEFSRLARRARILGLENSEIHEWIDEELNQISFSRDPKGSAPGASQSRSPVGRG